MKKLYIINWVPIISFRFLVPWRFVKAFFKIKKCCMIQRKGPRPRVRHWHCRCEACSPAAPGRLVGFRRAPPPVGHCNDEVLRRRRHSSVATSPGRAALARRHAHNVVTHIRGVR